MSVDPRATLEKLIAERREDYAGLSRLLGRNPAYIQQYVKRGTPRRLAEEDRRALARYFRVPEEMLGGPPAVPTPVAANAPRESLREAAIVAVPRRALGASAGAGSLEEDGVAGGTVYFAPALLRALGAGDPSGLSVIRVTGDSMMPLLADGDDILVDRQDGAERLRDGVYVLRNEEALMVKRIALRPDGGLAVLSDNPAHQSWPDADRSRIRIVGRVLWAGGRVR
ncbi:helix-turn-helix transcriptional regulator [Sphingomonas sp.]|uniref:S24 family peptidase n=1 Tax=Sphingomonas sp. TaxID=28214 RepID=UPI000DB8777D|nr:helix-turn-helix transcriptional regulator [Sphingomonas sp.]PZU10915.1 MAG: peptidase S24 [Sphingomonas sp.]